MKSMNKLKLTGIAVALLVLIGCTQEMVDQKRYEPLEKSSLFKDGRSSRPLVAGTVARGKLRLDDHLYTGRVANKFVEEFPFEITKEVLLRGQERFNIFCSVCHDRTGSGNGIVPQRGFKKPPSYHDQRFLTAPVGYFFWIMSNNFGKMPNYSTLISPHDRWAIAAYIRVLQLSQGARFEDAPPEEQTKLLAMPIVEKKEEEKPAIQPLEKPPTDGQKKSPETPAAGQEKPVGKPGDKPVEKTVEKTVEKQKKSSEK